MNIEPDDEATLRVCIVGSGMKFVSGISYYTYYLAEAFTEKYQTSVVLMRNLVPRRFYPGRGRVGAQITSLHTSDVCPTFDGVDWFAIPSLPRAGRFVRRQKPDVIVFQWWTVAVLPSFLYLLFIARRGGAKVILELHEDQDAREAELPLMERLLSPGLRHMIHRADHYVVHSEWDKARMGEKFNLPSDAMSVIPLGPFQMGSVDVSDANTSQGAGDTEYGDVTTVLFFGTIRPYKGLEDLIDAFELLPRDGATKWRLLVVGETWEGWDLPTQKIALSPVAQDIELINRYVTDAEIPGLFSRSDIVALPYHRSSASGPLHLTMQSGLPVVITDVGGLSEAARDYSGTIFVRPRDPVALAKGIEASAGLRGVRHQDLHSWEYTLELYSTAIDKMCSPKLGNPGDDT